MNLKFILTQSCALFILFTSILTVSRANENSKQLANTDFDENSLRKKRELEPLDDLSAGGDKRQRDFVGKRSREFVGKRAREFIGKRSSDLDEYNLDGYYSTIHNQDKRLRDFVGKRYGDEMFPDKRLRDFVGKREQDIGYDYGMDKRLRDFVGKRLIDNDDLPEMDKRQAEVVGIDEAENNGEADYDNDNLEKRILRELVGKRSMMDKRIREFLGKRLSMDSMYPVYFVRKPKYVRELIGKRGYPSPMVDNYALAQKRLRDFVGK